ncbi:substrate-binding domain-containing protein [Streptomyces sp. NPDC002758]
MGQVQVPDRAGLVLPLRRLHVHDSRPYELCPGQHRGIQKIASLGTSGPQGDLQSCDLHLQPRRTSRTPELRRTRVVGFNDMQFADEFQPPLTTVHVPHLELSAEAARLLLEQLDRSDESDDTVSAAKTVLLPVRLVIRESTADAVDRKSTPGRDASRKRRMS